MSAITGLHDGRRATPRENLLTVVALRHHWLHGVVSSSQAACEQGRFANAVEIVRLHCVDANAGCMKAFTFACRTKALGVSRAGVHRVLCWHSECMGLFADRFCLSRSSSWLRCRCPIDDVISTHSSAALRLRASTSAHVLMRPCVLRSSASTTSQARPYLKKVHALLLGRPCRRVDRMRVRENEEGTRLCRAAVGEFDGSSLFASI
jgi:hypothetical protein